MLERKTKMGSKMNLTDFVKSFYAAFEVRNYDYIKDSCTPDFVFSGLALKPLNRQETLEMYRTLFRAFPDWKFNLSNFKQMGDRVTCFSRITATHSGSLELPFMDIYSYQPTGKHVQLPLQEISIELRNGKVSRIDTAKTAGGGITGLLEQIGYRVAQNAKAG
jgi:predicted ester cyclase